MKTKHTQGEWKEQSFDFDNHTKIWITDSHNVQICYLNRFGNGMNFLKRQEANAKLIASAPELMKALNSMLKLFDRGLDEGTVGRITCDKAIEAIKKATN